ncbi:MAG: hypothetical protein EOP45_19290 [Sphingobacteriaceae bacterium]|nr:MAG: hypothetical protein EOP45_19290 [Sphingobacteriaceae bacterium]
MNLFGSVVTLSLVMPYFVSPTTAAMSEMYLFTDHPRLVTEFLRLCPESTATEDVLNKIVGLSCDSPPMLNTLLTILETPSTAIHSALFSDRCKYYRTLKLSYSQSIPHLDTIALFEQSPTFNLLHCRVHLLCQRIENAETTESITDLVESDLKFGYLTYQNVHILTDFISNDVISDKLSAETFKYLAFICGCLDFRLSIL